MNWKEEFKERWNSFYIGNFIDQELVGRFIEGQIKELDTDINVARKDLINQIISEAPEDRTCFLTCMPKVDICYCGSLEWNNSNQQWRELLTKHLK